MAPTTSKLCEDCGTRLGNVECSYSWCFCYGSDYAQDALENNVVVEPRDTGRRCEGCLPKSEFYCSVCKEFRCNKCAEMNDHLSPYGESKEWETCSFCMKRVCSEFELSCYRKCDNHEIVVCERCLQQPELRKNWKECSGCEELCCTAAFIAAYCPDCKDECSWPGHGEKMRAVENKEWRVE